MLSGLSIIGSDVNPVLHQLSIFGMPDGDVSAIAHHNREGNKRSCAEHLVQFRLHQRTPKASIKPLPTISTKDFK